MRSHHESRGRFPEVKTKKHFQIISPKSGRGPFRQEVAYESLKLSNITEKILAFWNSCRLRKVVEQGDMTSLGSGRAKMERKNRLDDTLHNLLQRQRPISWETLNARMKALTIFQPIFCEYIQVSGDYRILIENIVNIVA